MRIGVLTFHRSHNYGAFLQCYSLVEVLKNLGHDVSVINFNNISPKGYTIKWVKHPVGNYHLIKRYQMFNGLQALLPLTQPAVDSGDMEEFARYVSGKFDLIITGSDEVWRTAGNFRPVPNVYWLVGELDARKMAYAISSRSDFSQLPEDKQEKLREVLKDYDFISLRDTYSQQQVQSLTQQPVYQCCDPTFLSSVKGDPQRGREILRKHGVKKDTVIAVMGKERKLVKAVKDRFGKEADVISLYDYNPYGKNLLGLTPFEWIDVISAVDFMLTNYFHGMCFCIKNNTPFLAIDRREKIKERGKMYDLLRIEGLLDRFMTRDDDDYITKAVDYLAKALEKKETVDYTAAVAHLRETAKPFFDALENPAADR